MNEKIALHCDFVKEKKGEYGNLFNKKEHKEQSKVPIVFLIGLTRFVWVRLSQRSLHDKYAVNFKKLYTLRPKYPQQKSQSMNIQ
ncbi:hypothetical protein BLOT_015903 [Blomia tropicalis]|nr:hypothetical protein BLOT_015903 [Blomia tropicalis]